MPGDAGPAPESLWRFAVAVYGRPGIADLCLDLQDRHGVDVPLLLWAAWTGAVRGHALTGADLAAALAATAPWRRDVVAPLRAVRRRLKAGPSPIAPTPETDALRERVKALELEAERLQLTALAGHPAWVRDGGDAGAALAANLALLLPGAAASFTDRLHAAALSARPTVLASAG